MVRIVLFSIFDVQTKTNEMNGLNELDCVTLNVDTKEIKKGTEGTIVYDYGDRCMYIVEFFDNEHNTIGVIDVFGGDLTKN